MSATGLKTARTISISGDGTGSTSFDGTGNANIVLSNVSATGLKTARTISISGDGTGSTSFDGTGNANIALSNVSASSCTGNSATATKLATARTISISGDGTGSTVFDGTGNANIAISVNNADRITTNGVPGFVWGQTGVATQGWVAGVSSETAVKIASNGTIGQVWGQTGETTQGWVSSGGIRDFVTFIPSANTYAPMIKMSQPTALTNMTIYCQNESGTLTNPTTSFTVAVLVNGSTVYTSSSITTATTDLSININVATGDSLTVKTSTNFVVGGGVSVSFKGTV